MTSADWVGVRVVSELNPATVMGLALGVGVGAVRGMGYTLNDGSTDGRGGDLTGKVAAGNLGVLALGTGLVWAWSSPSAPSSRH